MPGSPSLKRKSASLTAQGVVLLSNLATAGGVAVVLLVYLRDRHQAKIARELSTYRTMQSLYRDYMKLCMERPELGLYDGKRPVEGPLTPSQGYQRLAGYELWISMCEAAHFEYNEAGHGSAFKRRQWDGWREYIRWSMEARADLRHEWTRFLGAQYDQEFMREVDAILAELDGEAKET